MPGAGTLPPVVDLWAPVPFDDLPVGLTDAAARRRTGLSEREVEVLHLAGTDLTNRDIAERLSLSQHTVARHLANARTKLGAANRTEAAVKLEERDSLARD